MTETQSAQAESNYGGTIFGGMDHTIANRPTEIYAQMRAAGCPIASPAGVVAATRADVEAVLHDHERFSSATAARLGNVRPLLPLEMDPPEQRRYRKILDPLFAPQAVAKLEGSIAALVNELIDGFGDATEIDFAKQFSMLLPSQIFLKLLGLPVEELEYFMRLKDGAIRPNELLNKPYDHPDVVEYKNDNAQQIYAYYNKILDQREKEPQDDLLTGFLTIEVDGDRLTRENILDMCFLLLTAGLDTVTASLDCFMAYLANNPEKRRALVNDPSLAKPVVEELLRWETPVQLVGRVATTDTELNGCPVKAGQPVYAFLGGANTDTGDLTDADDVRWDRQVNRHIAFGSGVHRCIGSHLARLELRVALREWHARVPDYKIKPGAELNYSTGVRSLESFPMIIGESL